MFTRPEDNLREFNIHENMTVADLGAGTGFYSILAGKIAYHGKVYAIEVQKEFLETIRQKAKEARVNNIEAIWGNVEAIGGTKLADNAVDRVIASDLFFQIEDKDNFIKETKRILKPNGKLLLIDHSTQGFNLGMQQAVHKEEVKKIFEAHNFSFEKEINAGDQHYGIILINKK